MRSLDTNMKKRTKYNNGGLSTSFSKGVFELEGSVAGNKQQRTSQGTASLTGGGYKASISKGYDTQSGKSQNYSLEKQLPNQSSVAFKKNKYNTSLDYHKKTSKGSNIRFGLNKNAQGDLGISMGFSKPI